jgi:glycosyltransferase involved in cell wall biosynthesis
MNQRRVAIQLISTGGFYGAERALLELAGYLGDHGWESHVEALEGQGAAELVNRAAAQGLPAEAFVPNGRMALVPMLARLRRLLRRHPCAVVHSHGYKPDVLLALLRAPRHLACVATCHNWDSETLKLKLLESLDKRALRRFDRIVAVSTAISGKLIDGGVPRERVSVIHNGISLPRSGAGARRTLRDEFGVPPGAKVIVQVGRLSRSKRNDLLVDTMSRLPANLDAHVLLVGDGSQRQALVDQVRRQGLERRVHFCGYRNDVAQILEEADVLVMTSDNEGLPIILLEAMAMHCPIVSTRVGEIPHVLRDGHDGWTVPTNDARAVGEAINEALSRPDMARERAENAHAKFLREYSRESMGASYLRLYEQIWTGRGWP